MSDNMTSRVFDFFITTKSYDINEVDQISNDTFSNAEIEMKLKKTVSVKAGELEKNPLALIESFVQFSTRVSEVIAMLHSIRFGGNFSGHEIKVFYINSDLENYTQFRVSFSNLRLPNDATFQLSLPDSEFQTIITKIKNEISATNLRRIEREIAVFVDYQYALNTTDSHSSTERFLSYWSSFNALYTSFAGKHMKPVIKQMIDGIEGIDRKILDFSDRDEILFICSI